MRAARRLSVLIFAALALLSPGIASAQQYSPNLIKGGDHWLITAFYDGSPDHKQAATQGICFKYQGTSGTHDLYFWWSDTYPDWNGVAAQEGDQVFMHGDFGRNEGHDSIDWEITTTPEKTIGAGHWKEWLEDSDFGRTIGFGNSLWLRSGQCQMGPDEAKQLVPKTKYPSGD